MTSTEIKHVGLNLGETDSFTHERAGSDIFGFWVYLMSDAVIFALLFATYGVMLSRTAGGPTPSDIYDIHSAFIETMLLLTSSFTFGMATISLKHGPTRLLLLFWLGITALLGLGFLGFEIHDFLSAFDKGGGPDRSGFLSSYFALVSLHGLHVTAGCLWIGVMMLQLLIFGRDTRVKINLLRLSLFWHFLDIVWIGIFSVVYLQGLA